jgi:hypothetical protein
MFKACVILINYSNIGKLPIFEDELDFMDEVTEDNICIQVSNFRK